MATVFKTPVSARVDDVTGELHVTFGAQTLILTDGEVEDFDQAIYEAYRERQERKWQEIDKTALEEELEQLWKANRELKQQLKEATAPPEPERDDLFDLVNAVLDPESEYGVITVDLTKKPAEEENLVSAGDIPGGIYEGWYDEEYPWYY